MCPVDGVRRPHEDCELPDEGPVPAPRDTYPKPVSVVDERDQATVDRLGAYALIVGILVTLVVFALGGLALVALVALATVGVWLVVRR